jgi:hypothetical protein
MGIVWIALTAVIIWSVTCGVITDYKNKERVAFWNGAFLSLLVFLILWMLFSFVASRVS